MTSFLVSEMGQFVLRPNSSLERSGEQKESQLGPGLRGCQRPKEDRQGVWGGMAAPQGEGVASTSDWVWPGLT